MLPFNVSVVEVEVNVDAAESVAADPGLNVITPPPVVVMLLFKLNAAPVPIKKLSPEVGDNTPLGTVNNNPVSVTLARAVDIEEIEATEFDNDEGAISTVLLMKGNDVVLPEILPVIMRLPAVELPEI
jgi:hypothetical protein